MHDPFLPGGPKVLECCPRQSPQHVVASQPAHTTCGFSKGFVNRKSKKFCGPRASVLCVPSWVGARRPSFTIPSIEIRRLRCQANGSREVPEWCRRPPRRSGFFLSGTMDRISCRRPTCKIESPRDSDARRDPDRRTRHENPCYAMNDSQPRRQSSNLAPSVPDMPLAASGKRYRCHRVSGAMPHKNPRAASSMRRTELRDKLRTSNFLLTLVGAERFELPTPCSQNRCATRLRYAPTLSPQYRKEFPLGNSLVPEIAVFLACQGSEIPRKPSARHCRTRHDQLAKRHCMPGIKHP